MWQKPARDVVKGVTGQVYMGWEQPEEHIFCAINAGRVQMHKMHKSSCWTKAHRPPKKWHSWGDHVSQNRGMGQVEEDLEEYLVPALLASRLHHHPSQRALSEVVHYLQASQQQSRTRVPSALSYQLGADWVPGPFAQVKVGEHNTTLLGCKKNTCDVPVVSA